MTCKASSRLKRGIKGARRLILSARSMAVNLALLFHFLFCIPDVFAAGLGTIQGYVRDEVGQGIDGARVESEGGESAVCRDDGFYELPLMAGQYQLIASADGYEPRTVEVFVSENAMVNQDFTLEPLSLAIESVQPNRGEFGQDLEVTITGAGFDHNTRVVMYPDSMNKRRILGSVDTPGSAEGVAVSGYVAYVADGDSGLRVIDVSDPAKPSLLGSVDTPGSAEGVATAGNVVYVADGKFGLRVIDVSDPAKPLFLGAVDTPGYANDVAVAGNVAYVADGYGLQVIDVRDPTKPSLRGFVAVGYALEVVVSSNVAYVAVLYSGLRVIDVSDPSNPSLLGSVDTPGIRGVAVAGNMAYVGAYFYGLQVIDVSDPSNPEIIGSVDTGEAWGVAVAGSVVYVAGRYFDLQVIDVSDPTSPFLLGSVDTDWAEGVTVVGNVAYVMHGDDGLQLIDVSNPANLFLRGAVHKPSIPVGVAVSGNVAYVVDHFGLWVIDVNNRASPSIIGSADTGGADEVAVLGNWAYVVGRKNGLQVIDLSKLAIVGSVDVGGSIYERYEVAVAGNVVYVTAYRWGSYWLQVIDVSDPAKPSLRGTVFLSISGEAKGVAVSGNVAYVAGGESGLRVIDVSDPAKPFLRASLDTPGSANGVAVSDNVVYVGDGESGLQVIDVSDPAKPSIIGAVDTGYASEVTAAGNVAYVAGGMSGLQVIDVSDPGHPVIICSLRTSNWPTGLAVKGQYAYLADGFAGLSIVPLPIEITPVTLISDSRIKATLPSPPLPGPYTLRVFNALQGDELLGAVLLTGSTDIYEDDNSADQAGVVILNDGTPREHTFHAAGDADWIKFYGVAGESYVVEANILSNDQHQTDMVIELYDAGGTSLVQQDTTGDPYADENLVWDCKEDGIYYARFWNRLRSSGEATRYDVTVQRPIANEPGTLIGFIKDAATEAPIKDATMKTNLGGSALSEETGQYELKEMTGEIALTVMASGYNPLCEIVGIIETGIASADFYLSPGDPITFTGKFGKTYNPRPVDSDFDCDGDVDGMDLVMLSRAMR